MAGKFFIKMLGTAMVVLLIAGLSGCTFRDAPPWDEDEMKTKMVDEDWAKKERVDGLEERVAKLEQRADDNAKAAEEARMTAEKALKCCRKEYDVVMTEEIYFDFNKFNVRADDYPALDRVAAKLKEDPDLICECKGHTDGIGNVDYNIVLGQKRADAARMYLINKHNIAMGRIAIRTFGEDAPVATNDTEQGRAKNRRVTIDVLGFAM
jgi:outer membrane protein OmpA-like peptidoglycan-associated protein